MKQSMDYFQKNLNIKRLSYDNLNRLMAKVISSMTASLRFEGEMNVDLNEFQTNLVPFPRLHFMTTSMAPVLTPEKAETEKNDVQSISETCFNPGSFLVKFSAMRICVFLFVIIIPTGDSVCLFFVYLD